MPSKRRQIGGLVRIWTIQVHQAALVPSRVRAAAFRARNLLPAPANLLHHSRVRNHRAARAAAYLRVHPAPASLLPAAANRPHHLRVQNLRAAHPHQVRNHPAALRLARCQAHSARNPQANHPAHLLTALRSILQTGR